MSSINPHYTFQYSQPEHYRFSHDSVFLARKVFELSSESDVQSLRGLDLCSGCGVIGLDFIYHCQKQWGKVPASFDFLEVQDVYLEHFTKNVSELNAGFCDTRFVNKNYEVLKDSEYKDRYDLILSNPPYFRPSQGKMSPSEFKNRCRFFIDADFSNLILGIENALKPGGQAYVLLRDLTDHGWSPFAEAQELLSMCSLEKIGDIRGTDLVLISKK
ncbi:N5-glutamine S-adenosyl-L-methionine-dependent methyltransferase [compost metagenome]